MIEKYPQLYNGKAYTVTIKELYDGAEIFRIRIYKGQRNWFSRPEYETYHSVPHATYKIDYCQLVKEAFRQYQRELDGETYIDNSLQEFMSMGEIKGEEF